MNATIAAAYCDGGVITGNPSPIGGTWAWCLVDATGARIAQASGVIPGPCTNNVSEFVAAVLALEALPPSYAGPLYTDSNVTRGRLFSGWALRGLPLDWVQRGGVQIRRFGLLTPTPAIRGVLLQGHPTQAELRAGVGTRQGYPVSVHNCWCDAAATQAGRRYLLLGAAA